MKIIKYVFNDITIEQEQFILDAMRQSKIPHEIEIIINNKKCKEQK